jgi:hypothetical protein
VISPLSLVARKGTAGLVRSAGAGRVLVVISGRGGRYGRVVLVVATVAALVFSAVTYAAANSLKLTGPHSNRLGTTFSYKITGYAAGAADFLVAWEQLNPHAGCASTYAAESARGFLPTTYGTGLETAVPVKHGSRVSIVARFHAVNPGEHGLCAYLISLETGDTYAHASVWWTNH